MVCGSDSCCPPPFQNVSGVGCIYTSADADNLVPFHVASAICNSWWHGADLYSPNDGLIYDENEMKTYLSQQGLY